MVNDSHTRSFRVSKGAKCEGSVRTLVQKYAEPSAVMFEVVMTATYIYLVSTETVVCSAKKKRSGQQEKVFGERPPAPAKDAETRSASAHVLLSTMSGSTSTKITIQKQALAVLRPFGR